MFTWSVLTPFNYIVITVAKSYFASVYFNGALKKKKVIVVWNELLKKSAYIVKALSGGKKRYNLWYLKVSSKNWEKKIILKKGSWEYRSVGISSEKFSNALK